MCNRLLPKLFNEWHPVFEEGMYAGLAVPAILKSREYAPLKSGQWCLYPFPNEEGSAAPSWLSCRCWVLPLSCCAGPCSARLSLCWPWHTSSVSAGAALLGCPCCLHWGVDQKSLVALVMIFFVSAGLSHSALTSSQNMLLFGLVTLL